MSVVIKFADSEWSAVQCGGILALMNGKERPVKWEPESRSFKPFGLINPKAEMTGVAAQAGTIAAGAYVYTCVEVDSGGNQGQGRPSGPAPGTGLEITVGLNGSVTLTLPSTVNDGRADRRWIYRSDAGGEWPVLGRVADIAIDTLSWQDTGAVTPDFDNFPLDQNVDKMPNKTYAVECGRRLIGWGSEPLEPEFTFTQGLKTAVWAGGDDIDEGCVGAALYPDNDIRGYVIDSFIPGSPAAVTLQDAFVPASESPNFMTTRCKLCRPSGEVVWSEPDDYENFPAASVRYIIKSGGDPETGCGVIAGRVLLMTVKTTHVLQWDPGSSPALGMGLAAQLSTTIGCTSHRTIQDCDGTLVWLSKSGLAGSSGGVPQIISDDIAPEFESIIKEATGRCRRAFAVNWVEKKRYICFIPTSADSEGCSRAIVMDYNLVPDEPRFRFSVYDFNGKEFTCGTIERHAVNIYSDSGVLLATDYREYPVLGDKDGYTWTFGVGDADGPTAGTISGTVTSADETPGTLDDSSAAFDTSGLGLSGMMVTVRRPSTGAEQHLLIASNTGTRLYIAGGFDWLPVAGDEYWVGGIEAYYETGWNCLGTDDRVKKLHRVHSTFKVEDDGDLDLSVYCDGSATPAALTDEGGAGIDLSTAKMRVSKKLSGRVATYFKFKWGNKLPNEPWTLRDCSASFEYGEP